jgi:hypothetical protein
MVRKVVVGVGVGWGAVGREGEARAEAERAGGRGGRRRRRQWLAVRAFSGAWGGARRPVALEGAAGGCAALRFCSRTTAGYRAGAQGTRRRWGAKRGAERTCEKRPNDLVSDGTPAVVDEGRPVGAFRGPLEVVTAEDGGDETEHHRKADLKHAAGQHLSGKGKGGIGGFGGGWLERARQRLGAQWSASCLRCHVPPRAPGRALLRRRGRALDHTAARSRRNGT